MSCCCWPQLKMAGTPGSRTTHLVMWYPLTLAITTYGWYRIISYPREHFSPFGLRCANLCGLHHHTLCRQTTLSWHPKRRRPQLHWGFLSWNIPNRNGPKIYYWPWPPLHATRLPPHLNLRFYQRQRLEFTPKRSTLVQFLLTPYTWGPQNFPDMAAHWQFWLLQGQSSLINPNQPSLGGTTALSIPFGLNWPFGPQTMFHFWADNVLPEPSWCLQNNSPRDT